MRLALPFEGGIIHFTHPRIDARDDPRHAGSRSRFLCNGLERGDADHRQAAGEREALRQAAGDAQPGERAGPRAECNGIQRADAGFRFPEQRFEHGKRQLGMTAGRALLDAGDFAIQPQGDRAPVAGGFERREEHRLILCLIEFLLWGSFMKDYQIAVIPGDGIGREVIPEGVRVLEAAAARHGLRLKWQEFPWSCDWYKAHGRMCPADAPQILRKFDAVYFGAVGNPSLVPDHIAVWGLLINFRRLFDLYVNLRPVRLFEGLPCPLAGRKPGDLDYIVVRENTEGEYGNVGGRIYEGTEREVVMQQSIFSRKGVDRIMRYAFELSRTRKKHLTSCTKSNGITITMPYWDERFAAMGRQYPDVRTDQYHVDGLTIQMVLNPERFDVIVASNLFGDILSDLGPATAGTIGIAASGNINPERTAPSIFEPVHGSAPDIAGRKIANPIGQIWSGALMLEHLGHPEAAADVVRAIERVVLEGPHTADMKGKASTSEVGAAVADAARGASKKAA